MHLDLRTDVAATVRGVAVASDGVAGVDGRFRRRNVTIPAITLAPGEAKRITSPPGTVELILNVSEHGRP